MDCGCDIDWDGATDAKQRAWIVYCPMHEAAAEMLETLRSLENDAGQMPAFMWEKVQAAVARAGGKAKS